MSNPTGHIVTIVLWENYSRPGVATVQKDLVSYELQINRSRKPQTVSKVLLSFSTGS